MGARWTPGEDKTLGTWYGSYGYAWSGWWCNGGHLLENRSRNALRNRARVIGVAGKRRGRRKWKDSEDKLLLQVITRLSAGLERTPIAIASHMAYLVSHKEDSKVPKM